MPFEGLRRHDDPGIAHLDRLACGGTVNVPSARHGDRLHAWFNVLLGAILTLGVLAVIYGYFAITP